MATTEKANVDLTDTHRLPLDETAIKEFMKDPARFAEYMRFLVVELQDMYETLSDAINYHTHDQN